MAKSYDALEDDTGSSAALADKGEDSIKQHTKAKSVNGLPLKKELIYMKSKRLNLLLVGDVNSTYEEILF